MEAWPTSTPSLDPEQPRPTGVAQAASQANADLGASRPSALLLGAGLPILGLARHGPGEFTAVGGQRLADGHVPGHIGQPPGRGPGRPRNRSGPAERDLAWVPIPRLAGVDVQGADHPTVQLHPCSRSPTRPSSCSRLMAWLMLVDAEGQLR